MLKLPDPWKKFYPVVIAILTISTFTACSDNSKEKSLINREALLMEKERAFGAKEADYQSLLKMRDSLMQQRDTIQVMSVWPDQILGKWNSQTVCIASNCNDYLIGDTRNNIWEFTQDSTKLYVNVRDRDKLVRVYTAMYTNDRIQMYFATDSTSQKIVEMNVDLNQISANRITGMRNVKVAGTCNAKFNVTLTKSSN